MNDATVKAICAEFNIEVIEGNLYPVPGQTRAVETLKAIGRKYGEGHLRLVISTLAETEGNQGFINRYSAWAVSDLIIACSEWIENDITGWMDTWDKIPLGSIMWTCQELYGVVTQRQALAGAIYVLLVHFGPGKTANREVGFKWLRRVQVAEGEPTLTEQHRQQAIEAGKALLEAKAALPHGEFMEWVKSQCAIPYHSAQRCMQIAKDAA